MVNNAELTDTVLGGQNNWQAIDRDGAVVNPLDFIDAPDNKAITYGHGGLTLNANRLGAVITAINGNGTLRVSQDLSIGSIIGGLPITIDVGRTLTLTGTAAAPADHGFEAVDNTYTGLGDVRWCSFSSCSSFS